jgi:nitrogenase molybdenum-iron protein alpha/beta subunit
MSWRAFALATALAAATSSGLGVSTASAGSYEEIRTSGAWAKFDDLGEKLMVGDIAKDGKGARAYLHWDRNKSASVYVGGYGEPLDTKDLAIREGTKVTLTVCHTKHRLDVECSDPQWAEA